jgi:hypothetical protein
VNLDFRGEIFTWRGPAPYYFVRVPEPESAEIAGVAEFVSYGWGVIPVTAQVGSTEWTTSLFPKHGGYLVPLKDKVRIAEQLDDGDTVTLRLSIGS